jgi:nucleotide-binding universal stress UspA family protein
MKTLLVLTDFSKTAEVAALYACTLASQLQAQTIVLYHSYQAPIPVSDALVWVNIDETVPQSAIEGLQELESQIREKVPKGVLIRHRSDTIHLTDINHVAKEEEAGLIVMGTLSKTKLEEIVLGSNAIKVCESSDYPVVLVPVQIKIQRVGQIAFACNMKEIEKTIPEAKLKMILDEFKIPLSVLNVDHEDKHFTPETPMNTMSLHNMLQDYNPSYYNINSDNIADAILEFAKKHPASIVLLITKRHNLMEGLFYSSLTRQLAYVSPFPLLVLREMER